MIHAAKRLVRDHYAAMGTANAGTIGAVLSERVSPDWPPGTIIRFSRTVIELNSWAIWNVRSSPL